MRSGAGVGEGELGEDPGPTAELLRQLAVVQRWEEGTRVTGILKKADRDLGMRAPEGRPAFLAVMLHGRCAR